MIKRKAGTLKLKSQQERGKESQIQINLKKDRRR